MNRASSRGHVLSNLLFSFSLLIAPPDRLTSTSFYLDVTLIFSSVICANSYLQAKPART